MELLQRDPQRRSAPFAPMPCRLKSKLQPLTRQFFSNLIKLESDLQHQDYTMETLDELTSHYATAVEYYGALKDEIASYFVFKIQDSLAKKKSLKMLMEQSLTKSQERESPAHNSKANSKQDKKILFSSLKVKDETIKENVKEESEEEEQGEEPDFQKQRRERPEYRRMRISISRMNNRNQKCVMLFQKVENEKKNEEQNFNKTLDSFKDVSQNNDGLIMDGIKNQKERIRQKIEQRKQNSFATYSMGNSLGTINKTLLNLSFNVPERRDHSRLDFVLGELDNYDEYDYNEDFSAGIKDKKFEKSPNMKFNKQKSFPSNDDEENPLDNEFDDFAGNQVLQPIENLVPKQQQDNNKNPHDMFSYSEEDVCFQKKSRVNVLKSSAKRSNKENAPRYVD